jgi:hypothetical protein
VISAQLSGRMYTAFAGVAPPVVAYDASDVRFQPSDFAGTVTRSTSLLRLTAPLPQDGFENCAPGARIRWRVVMPTAGQMNVEIGYTGLVTRTDTYLPDAPILVNGAEFGRFTQTKALPATPHPVASATRTISLPPGEHLCELIVPICASIELRAIALPAGATLLPPPPRPTKMLVAFGDSRIHGFNAVSGNKTMAYRIAELLGVQIANIGRGGRQVIAGDGSVAGGISSNAALYLCDFNNFVVSGGNLATFGAAYRAVMSNFRAAATAIGEPTKRLYVLTSLDAPAALAGGAYAANSPTLEAYRARIRTEVLGLADPYVTLLEGLGAGMPTGIGSFVDGVHATELAQDAAARVLAAQMTI